MQIQFNPLPTNVVRTLQEGGPDFWGNTPEVAMSDGAGIPCRHCMGLVPAGKAYLILAHRPFTSDQPYAKVGPIFLCKEHCRAPIPSATLPDFLDSPTYLIKAYTADERIRYGTGAIVPTTEIPARAAALLSDPDIAFVDVRSARNNCFHTRITREDMTG